MFFAFSWWLLSGEQNWTRFSCSVAEIDAIYNHLYCAEVFYDFFAEYRFWNLWFCLQGTHPLTCWFGIRGARDCSAYRYCRVRKGTGSQSEVVCVAKAQSTQDADVMRNAMQAYGPCWCEWGCPHCTQATSKEKCSNVRTRRVPRPVWIGPKNGNLPLGDWRQLWPSTPKGSCSQTTVWTCRNRDRFSPVKLSATIQHLHMRFMSESGGICECQTLVISSWTSPLQNCVVLS